MLFEEIRAQVTEIFNRAIETGISVRQNFPIVNLGSGTIGDLASTVALKNIAYNSIYKELELNNQYHIKLPDGGLLIFQYQFNKEELTKHRLGFFPSPSLPTVEEAPELYGRDELYGDIILERIVRFPVRFDFDPQNYKQRYHPHSHLTLGQFDNCRIPVSSPVSPNIFFLFVLRNFYFNLYRRHKNKLERKMRVCRTDKCITMFETDLPFFSI